MPLKTIAPIHHFNERSNDRLPDGISLEKNFTLERFNKYIYIVDRAVSHFPNLYSQGDIQELKACKFCVVYKHTTSGKNQIEEGQQKARHFIESLRVVKNTAVECSTFIFDTDEKAKSLDLPKAVARQTSRVYLVDEAPGETFFSSKDASKIKLYYRAVEFLYNRFTDEYNRVLNSFIFFQLGYLTRYTKLRIVPFVTALESLFNTSEQEIGYSLRMRCASFLGTSLKEKQGLIERIKEIYKIRSAAVHGASFPKKLLRNKTYMLNCYKDAEYICRNCYQKIFDENLISFFSQKNKDLSQNLDKLVLG